MHAVGNILTVLLPVQNSELPGRDYIRGSNLFFRSSNNQLPFLKGCRGSFFFGTPGTS